MLKKLLSGTAAALLGITMMASVSIAQDATPAAADCPTTTSEENAQIVQQYMDAVMAGDTETADSLLSDDFEHDLSIEGAEVPNDPGNDDELANIGLGTEVNFEVVRVIAQDEWVAVDMEYDLTGENLGLDESMHDQSARVDVMVFARIECGQIAEAHFTSDMLEALMQHGYDLVPPGE